MARIDDLEGCRDQIRQARAQFVELGDGPGVQTAENYDAVILWWLRDLDTSREELAGIQGSYLSNGFDW